jgi:mono/diheme cytochrome c family protein
MAGERRGSRRGSWVRAGWVGLAALLVLVGVAAAVVRKPGIGPIPSPQRHAFARELVRRGSQLAAAGFCTNCHTNRTGKVFAGGRPLATPFGTIYGSNITPDRDTGMGTWSLAAFTRAMREGVDASGRYLYPAFPYNHFTGLADADIEALYAFLMTREPVRAQPPEPDLRFPYNIRPILAGWNMLFLRKGEVERDPAQSEAWNRGRYLVEALAHCGACHTPRNRLGAENRERYFAGGEAEGWWAPPLDRSSPAPVPWDEESLFNYLRSWDSGHGGGVGPMQPVVEGLAQLPPQDVRAIATYVAAFLSGPPTPRQARTDAITSRAGPASSDAAVDRGGQVFNGACASCHESGGTVPFTVRSLAQHTALTAPDPRNVIHVILGGVQPAEGEVGGFMPAFQGTLTEAQIADLVTYLRARFSDEPAWPDVGGAVHRIAQEGARSGARPE